MKKNSDKEPEIINHCLLCKSKRFIFREGKVRDIKSIKIKECIDCRLVYLDTHSHLGNNFYEDSGMHSGDIKTHKQLLKGCYEDDHRRFNMLRERLVEKSILDFGCGAGGFLLQAKDHAGFVCGLELEKKHQESYIEKDLLVYPSLDELVHTGKKI